MLLLPPRSLEELSEYAERTIKSRLTDLGFQNPGFELNVGGDPQINIEAVLPIESAAPGGLIFAADQARLKTAEASPAAAVVLPAGLTSDVKPYIQAPEPRLVFSVVMELAAGRAAGPDPGLVGNIRFKDCLTTELGEGVVIGDWCYVGANVKIGRGTRIYPQVFIDDGVTIGEDCLIYPRVVLLKGTRLGRGVVVHSGAVIGDDGFSYNQVPDMERGRLLHVKNSHAGGVVIEDFVEVGSQVCIDRGLAEDTVIGEGTKIDNLAQIAHNVKTGRDCLILSQVGISGSVRLGDQVFLLGQAGLVDGVTVGDQAIIIGKGGVSNDVPPGRQAWAGRPIQPADREWKEKALLRRELPRLREFWRILKKAGSFEELQAGISKMLKEKKS